MFYTCQTSNNCTSTLQSQYNMYNKCAYLLHRAESFLRSQLVLQLIKKFPAFYGTRKFITVLTTTQQADTPTKTSDARKTRLSSVRDFILTSGKGTLLTPTQKKNRLFYKKNPVTISMSSSCDHYNQQ